MKKIVFLVVAILTATAGSVFADTATVSVSANVVGTCRFTGGGTVSFTDLDPTTGGLVNGTVVQPAFWCTKGASYTLSDDSGLYEVGAQRRLKHAALAEYIPYSLSYTTTGTGNGKTSPLTMDITSSIAGADYINASAGNYGDTITLTITP